MGDGAGDRRRALVRADPKMRPGIRQAAEALRSRKFRMPLLLPKMPVAVYLQPFGASTMQFSDTTATVGSMPVHLDDEPRHSDRGVQLQLAASGHRALEPKSIDRLCTRMRIV